jgi:hypothetical protein
LLLPSRTSGLPDQQNYLLNQNRNPYARWVVRPGLPPAVGRPTSGNRGGARRYRGYRGGRGEGGISGCRSWLVGWRDGPAVTRQCSEEAGSPTVTSDRRGQRGRAAGNRGRGGSENGGERTSGGRRWESHPPAPSSPVHCTGRVAKANQIRSRQTRGPAAGSSCSRCRSWTRTSPGAAPRGTSSKSTRSSSRRGS